MATNFPALRNNAKTKAISGHLNNVTNPVTFDVTAGEGAKFPASGQFYVTVYTASQYPDPGDDPLMEILLVTNRSGNTFTAQRAQFDTPTVAHPGTPDVRLLILADHLVQAYAAINALEAIQPRRDIFLGSGTSGPFPLSFAPVVGSLRADITGIQLAEGDHFTLVGQDVMTTSPVDPGETLNVYYEA